MRFITALFYAALALVLTVLVFGIVSVVVYEGEDPPRPPSPAPASCGDTTAPQPITRQVRRRQGRGLRLKRPHLFDRQNPRQEIAGGFCMG